MTDKTNSCDEKTSEPSEHRNSYTGNGTKRTNSRIRRPGLRKWINRFCFTVIAVECFFRFRQMGKIVNIYSVPIKNDGPQILQTNSSGIQSGDFPSGLSDTNSSLYHSTNYAFSACILIKDDNDKLPEWLGYHYTAIPLVYLIVAVDPTSKTSPAPILELWNRTTEMKILQWSDENFMPEGEELESLLDEIPVGLVKEKAAINDEETDRIRKIKLHRVRQKQFLSSCLVHHKRNRRNWTMLIDTDEYLVFNKEDEDGNEDILLNNYKSPTRTVEAYRLSIEKRLKKIQSRRRRLPGVENSTVSSFIYPRRNGIPWLVEPCMPLPRLFFGSKESPSEKNQEDVPKIFNGTKFDTLRYRKHAMKGAWDHNLYDKSIVDVSRIPWDKFEMIYDPHRPLLPCRKIRTPEYDLMLSRITRFDQTLLRVHHYLGSWDSYSSRDDSRRTKERYDQLGNVDYGDDNDIRPWIGKFVEVVGEESAKLLLQTKLN
mmetsp:Transcript_953/g.1878  ORF Transcript_953/g.1878 Transcript_953/m.1878 type:complete len:485 (-) Transcript_953:498-1952(-)